MGPDGVLRELTGLDELVARVRDTEPEAVAVCLLHAYRHPEHERAIGDALREALPGVHVSLSHEAVGTFREHERAATTEVDAALSPLLSDYLRRLVERCEEAGLPRPDVMQSTGGLADVDDAGAHAATTVLSGPAGGAAGAAWIAGDEGALCFDMGGTSCDVCVIEGGRVRETSGRSVGDRPIALPMLDLHTVGAGGGSIGWADAGGALRVGPRSAGARPGARVLRQRRRGADGDRREPGARVPRGPRSPAASRWTARPPSSAVERARRGGRARARASARRASSTSRTPRWCGRCG